MNDTDDFPKPDLSPERSARDTGTAMKRGWRQKCPNCGEGNLYQAYLKVNDHCPSCRETLSHHRADDAPPYFTIFVVGHIIIPLVLLAEKLYQPETWVHLTLWLPLTLFLSLYFLPRIKGVIIGLQWAKYMHGFDPNYKEETDWSGA